MTDFAIALDPQLVPDVITELVHLIAPIKSDQVGPGSVLIDDLGFHSIAVAELGFTIEDLFGIEQLQERTNSLETLEEIIVLTQEALATGAATLPTLAHLQSIFSRFGGEWPGTAA